MASSFVRDDLNAALGDRYHVQRALGRGGMATVWLAHDLRYDRMVALKVLEPELAGAIGVERFLREIRMTARVQHPHIIPVLDSGVYDGADGGGLPWFTMAYVDGESLRQRMTRERQLPIEDALRIAESTAAALHAAHAQGIVHRDIKPENLLLAGDHTYVADFGIAKAVLDTGTERLTDTGVVIGTPTYMSPEQASSDAVDARTDQYALATVLYEMLAGEPPFTGASTQAIVARRFAESARPLRPLRPTVPASVEAAVLRALERVPAGRFATVADLAAALRTPAASRAPKPSRILLGRRTALAALAVLLIIAVAATTSFVARRPRRATMAPTAEAVALFRRGMLSYEKRTPAGAAAALDAFSAAIRMDSTYSDAWSGLARTYDQAYGRRFLFLGAARDSALHLALAAVDRALAADPLNANAWLTKGMVDRHVDPTDVTPPLRSFQRAVVLDSSLAQAWHQIAVSDLEAGRTDDAFRAWRKAVAVNPKYVEGVTFLALAHYWRRQYDSAAHWVDSAIVLDPTFLLARTTQGFVAIEQNDFARAMAAFSAAERVSTDVEFVTALGGQALVAVRAGRRAEARRLLARAESLATRFSPASLHMAIVMAQPYAALSDTGHAMAWLSQFSPTADTHFQLHLRCDPPFDAIATDSRFQALLTIAKPPPPHGC